MPHGQITIEPFDGPAYVAIPRGFGQPLRLRQEFLKARSNATGQCEFFVIVH